MFTFVKDECGVTAIEYGVFTSFAFGLIVMVYGGAYNKISDALMMLNTALSIS